VNAAARPLPDHPVWRSAPRSIAVFRALQLGDLLCAVPALRALRRAFPHAHIALVGLQGAAGFVQRYGRYIDELIVFPGLPGMPEQSPREQDLPAFYRAMRTRRFDVALQMHGSGELSRDVVRRFGAARIAGFAPRTAGAREPGWWLPWPDSLPEPLRYLALMRFLGLPADDAAPEFPLARQDERQARRIMDEAGLRPGRTVLVHPGARLPSRRWPVERYALVAQALARQGYDVALTGAADERPLTARLAALADVPADAPLRDLAGRTSLGELAALLRASRLLVCNDTGVSHVAAAVGARSVVVASGSDVRRWAPLDAARHTVLWCDASCRPCSHHECPIGHPCALGVGTAQVLRCAQEALVQQGEPPCPIPAAASCASSPGTYTATISTI